MKFFTDYFTLHHLKNAPHKWLVALFVSPLHMAELHYQKRYHLRYGHAKKLFIFDLLLLLTVAVISVATLVWYYYDPTVTDKIKLTIISSADKSKNETNEPPRLLSGERVAYTVLYENQSQVELNNISLRLHLPKGFIVEAVESNGQYSSSSQNFSLSSLSNGANGAVKFSGIFFGTPEKEEQIIAFLTYSQRGKQTLEVKRASLLATLRGSVITAVLDAPDTIINGTPETFKITLTNTSENYIPFVSMPFPNIYGATFTSASSTAGIVEKNTWIIHGGLKPKETVSLSLNLSGALPDHLQKLDLLFLPEIRIGDASIPQTSVSRALNVSHPRLSVDNSWPDGVKSLRPGEETTLLTAIKNSGDTTLDNLTLYLPLPSTIIDAQKFVKLNRVSYKNGTATISFHDREDLTRLLPGDTRVVAWQIPTRALISNGTDISLILNPRTQAKIQEKSNAIIEKTSASLPLLLGTRIFVETQARYFTIDGDQIGRGPLPPVVGKETKYWILVRVSNTTSKVKNLLLNANLPVNIQFTGKSSVNKGDNVIFNALNKTILWKLAELDAHDTALVNFELSLTPTETERGATPILINNIVISGEDGFISGELEAQSGAIDSSLSTDIIARAKGVVVK